MFEQEIRSCSKCGTVFRERLGQINDVIDLVEECYKGDKENGICRNCCGCFK